MPFPYKLVAFDLDGTLAESKQPITNIMADLLTRLSKITKVAVISGGSFTRFKDQLLRTLTPSPNIILLPTEGSERFEYVKSAWTMMDRQPFSEDLKNQVYKALNELISDPQFEIPPHPEGDYIEDRDTEIAFSALGQNAELAEKEKWDPTRSRRFKLKAALEAKVPGVMVAVAGTTSLDILPKGFDKGKGLEIFIEKIGLTKQDVLFVGDAIVPGGNDYAVSEVGIKTIQVGGPKDTALAIQEMLDAAIVQPEPTVEKGIPIFPENAVVYFCAEYALDAQAGMYAGGLGILAADYVLEAGDENIPFIAVGVRYGKVVPAGFALLSDITIEIPIGLEKVKAKIWHRALSTNTHILLLDAALSENSPEQQKLTSHLYDIDFYTRLKQQMVLGIGGVRALAALKISPRIYHLNEGHTSFAGVALMIEKPADLGKIVGTKHTILSEAGMLIKKVDLEAFVGPYAKEFGVKVDDIFEKGKFELSTDIFSTTKFVMASSVKKNAVSVLHAVFEKTRHPHSTLISITNGVYRKRWQAKELLTRSPALLDDELLQIKRKLRLDLFAYIEEKTGKKLNPDICTLVWSRRFAAYKRPYLLFSDQARLIEILSNTSRPLQCIISGKAHEGDAEGEDTIERIIAFSNLPAVKGRVIYLPDYNVSSAEKMTRGADIWLNTPELGKEACGTSGMKACLNGALQCSIRDGWVDEVPWEGRGWTLPVDNTASVLYDLLEHEILPCFYDESLTPWVSRMRSTIELVEKNYTADRMLKDYEKKLYTW